MTQFLIDENLLGIDRYFEDNIQYQKVGYDDRLPLGSDDRDVAKFAKENNLIIVTNDGKLIKQCNLFKIDCIYLDLLVDLAKKVNSYQK